MPLPSRLRVLRILANGLADWQGNQSA